MKSEKPRRKGQNAAGFQWISSRISYAAGKRAVHQRAKKREENAADSSSLAASLT